VNTFEGALDDCLREIARGATGSQECLARYPEYAARLEPLLNVAARVARGRALALDETHKKAARARVMAYVFAHAPREARGMRPVWRTLTAVAVLVLVLVVATTVLAQAALPGDLLYPWKRSTERIWRLLAPDPVGVDIYLVDRRADELLLATREQRANELPTASNPPATSGLLPGGLQPPAAAEAVQGLHEALNNLQTDNKPASVERIQKALKDQQKALSEAGVKDKVLDDLLNGLP